LVTRTLIEAGRDLASLPLPIALELTNPGQRDFFGGMIPVGSALDIGAHEAFGPGDYNGNGTVDAGDYTIWRDTFGSIDDLRADGDGDRKIDEDDYSIWKSLFGTTYNGGLSSVITVPEPTSEGLLILGSALGAATVNRLVTFRSTLRGAKSCG
jgi:Dockerin type I domain